ncbi:MerR family transcriptional regulator [Thiomicrospira aerophila AL3]|uniref:MerR family transcriptional regulator n=1 Tax=Thiomicrospira aerophila AL3 TaxID=717772 RepID=W0DTC6_9GAMM|nr:MerR family transcriptional regulator [Thiomicrospira aerophila]AHF00538.1 MerR family transcriptional regulator [Thiomicrospira aerophila AL3]
MMNEHSKDHQALYPIREVSRLTGIKPITLRAWERRYGLVEPVRTPSGHRLYTENHLAIIKEAMMLVDTGLPISQVKAILTDRAELLKHSAPAEAINCDWHDVILQAISAQSYQQLHSLTHRMLDANRDYRLLATHLLRLSQAANLLDPNSLFWHQAWIQELNQQLAHRLHLWRQQTYQSKELILILHHLDTPSWLHKLMGLHCYEQGLTPVFIDTPFKTQADMLLPANLTHFKGVIYLLTLEQEYHQLSTDSLLQPIGSLQCWIMGHATFEDENQATVATDLRAWPFWFEPLLINPRD